MFIRNLAFLGNKRQNIIANATILIAGMGGLGCIVANNLVRLGIGKLIIVDHDTVRESDLNRQILYDISDIGKLKVGIASVKLKQINPNTEIIPITKKVVNLECLMKELNDYEYNGIADCLDNYKGRFILEKLLSDEQFLVHGGVQNDFGQITTIKNKFTESLAKLYKDQNDSKEPIAVLPQTVTTIGSMMTQEIMNNLFGKPKLINKLLIVELSDFSFFQIDLK